MAAADGRALEVFDVSVLGAETHVWLSVHSHQGSVFGVPRRLPDWPLPSQDGSPVDWLTRAVRHARAEAGSEALAVGNKLTELVFGVPEVMALLQQARGAASSAGAQLLVRVLAAPQAVSAWPWELLTDPQRPDRFLTTARDVHVVRSGRARTYPVRQSPIEPPLNLLLVMSSPLPSGEIEQEAPFDLYEEKRALLTELQPLVDKGLLHVEVEDRPTVERLRSRIGAQRRGFHLFHYLGHAQPSGLKLEQRNGRGRLVTSQSFATLLQQMPDLRLAVFAGCETARAPANPNPDETWPGELSAADYCVRDACPMVVGMQAVLPFGTERLFTRFFYQALTGGQPVAEALRLARLAIADDEFAGGSLVNWAVPCLFVGGSLPGPIADPTARAVPPAPQRRISLRLGVRQGDLRFISRLSELRVAVDVLCGRSRVRLLHVIGLPGTGKTAFLDRTLEELDRETVQLFISAARLVDEPDPVRELCLRVAEVVDASGRDPAREGKLESMDWWERLLETLADVPLALVIDDGDLLRTDEPGAVQALQALQALTQRRSRTRLAVAANEEISALTAPLTSDELRRIQLHALSWPEVWQWIRRNLPVLTRYEEADLAPFYYDLPHLEQWEQLADAVSARRTLELGDMPGLVEQIAARVVSSGVVAPARPPVFGGEEQASASVAALEVAPRRALRVAVAGPFTAGREAQFSRGVTQFAAEHRVSGRLVAGQSADVSSTLAELLSLGTPFGSTGTASTDDILAWLEEAAAAGADLLVLDFGGPQPMPAMSPLLERLRADGRLVLAAGGNGREPCYPAWERSTLAVGALEEDGRTAAYSPYFADDAKPDLYAPKRMRGSAVATLLADPDSEGTSMSALYAAAAAIAVWATDRGLSGEDVRQVLLETAAPFDAEGGSAQRLDVEAALACTRRQLLVDALQWDALELDQLLAETGMRPEVAMPLLDALVAEGLVTRIAHNGQERFEDPQALYLEYARLRQRPSSWERTAALQRLVDQAQQLARRGRYTAAKVQALWRSSHDGRRIVAVGVMQARPDLGDVAILAESITAPRSAFEQYQALRAAAGVVRHLGAAARERLVTAVTDARASGAFALGTDRDRVAAAVLEAAGAEASVPCQCAPVAVQRGDQQPDPRAGRDKAPDPS